MVQEPWDTRLGMRTSRPMPGAGRAPGWNGTGVCGNRCLCRLKQGWSPEQVAGRLAMESGKRVISHESIYRFIYAQMARKKDYGWRHYLPRAKSKRGWRGRKGGSPASFMAMRRPIAERPQSAADRRTPGLGGGPDAVQYLWTCGADHARTLFPHPLSAQAPWQGIQAHRRCDVAPRSVCPLNGG